MNARAQRKAEGKREKVSFEGIHTGVSSDSNRTDLFILYSFTNMYYLATAWKVV
jgi:hypothetical protein